MIFAAENPRSRRCATVFTVAALLALTFVIGAPCLLTTHHHSDPVQNGHCAFCLFASVQIEPPHSPCGSIGSLALIDRLLPGNETSRTLFFPHSRSVRAPPAA